MRPDYDPPSPRLVRPLKWEWSDHPERGRIVRLWSVSNQAWSQQLAWTGAVHEGLERGEPFEALVADARAHLGDRSDKELRDKVGTYLYMLMVEGYVGMDFPAPPERFAPHLITRKALGRGGVGVAWLCHDERNGADVVVKHAWDYFQRLSYTDHIMRDEANVLAAVEHTGILRLHDTFERDGILHLVREYVDGTPLVLARQDDAEWQRKVALEILDIVAHLVQRGYLILDLRPTNFFVRATDGRVVLADVGSCVPHSNGEATVKKGIGTPGFTAPETRRKGHATTASVLYGYGRLLFQIAAGRRPLKEWTREDLMRELGDHGLAPAIAAVTSSVPEERLALADLQARLGA